MKDPGTQPHHDPPEGGKARERLKAFLAARGMTEADAGPIAAANAAAVPQAVALEAGLAQQVAQAQPQWHWLGPEFMPNGQTAIANTRVPVSGRVAAIAIDPSNSNHLLCGSAGGGIWESFSRGADWAPRTDSMLTLTTGALAFDPSNTATVYAGTGEGNSYSSLGQGILRSTDGGTTWALLTAGPFVGQGFFRIIVDQANRQHLLAATTGGLYESADGGVTWQVRRAVKTWEVAMQPGGGATAEVLAASSDGLQRSTDGGTTWAAQALTGAPAAWDRLAVAIAPSDGSTAFAFGASAGRVYLWRRSSGVWSALTTPAGMDISQAWYDWYVAAAPDQANQVYLGAKDVYRGDLVSGAWTWTDVSAKSPGDCIHLDQHAIAFDPANASTVYCGCDGGLFRSPDRGVTWISLNAGLGITEIEYMALDRTTPGWLLAGTQDNGSILYLGSTVFQLGAVGDGGDCGVDQTNPNTCYHSYYYMGLEKSTARGAAGTFNWIGPNTPAGFNTLWYPPMGVNGPTVVQAGQSVYISFNSGLQWAQQPLPAGHLASAVYLPTSALIYIATTTGGVFSIASDPASGVGWWAAPIQLTSPRAAYISALVVDPSNANRIWVTISQTGGGQVYRSDDGAKTWNNMTAGLPALPINSVAVDNTNSSRVWVSADVGVYQSLDAGATWTPFYQNLPNVLVEDLEFHPAARVLRAATRSRGVWEAKIDQAGSSVWPPAMKACVALQVIDATGAIQVFATQTGKSVAFIKQTSTGWGSWTSLGGTVTSALTGGTNANGSLELFVRGADGTLNHVWQSGLASTAWNAGSLGGFITGDPVVAANTSGCLEVFARGQDGSLMHITQTTPSSSSSGGWGSWSSLGGVITSSPAVFANTNGCLEVFARGQDGSLMHITQTTPGGSYGAWSSLGGSLTGAPAVNDNQDGRLEVFARGQDGSLMHIAQTTAGGGYGAWSSLGGGLNSDPTVLMVPGGCLYALVQGTDGALYYNAQVAAGGASGWTGWNSLGGIITCTPAAIVDYNLCLEVFARGTDGALYRNAQTAQGSSTWTGWSSLGGTLLGFQ